MFWVTGKQHSSMSSFGQLGAKHDCSTVAQAAPKFQEQAESPKP